MNRTIFLIGLLNWAFASADAFRDFRETISSLDLSSPKRLAPSEGGCDPSWYTQAGILESTVQAFHRHKMPVPRAIRHPSQPFRFHHSTSSEDPFAGTYVHFFVRGHDQIYSFGQGLPLGLQITDQDVLGICWNMPAEESLREIRVMIFRFDSLDLFKRSSIKSNYNYLLRGFSPLPKLQDSFPSVVIKSPLDDFGDISKLYDWVLPAMPRNLSRKVTQIPAETLSEVVGLLSRTMISQIVITPSSFQVYLHQNSGRIDITEQVLTLPADNSFLTPAKPLPTL